MKKTSNKQLMMGDDKITQFFNEPYPDFVKKDGHMFGFKDIEPPVDSGFDYVHFPDLNNESKAKALPKLFVDEVEMTQMEQFISHVHVMK